MSTSRTQEIIWSPNSKSNQFLIGSNIDLRLYEYVSNNRNGKTDIRVLSVSHDIPLLKCFAWSPDPNYQSLIAAGLTSGKTIIMNIYDGNEFDSNSTTCNVVAFSPSEPKLLATGLDKMRNEHSLLIWDIEQARYTTNIPSSMDNHNKLNDVTTTKFIPETPSRAGSISNWSGYNDSGYGVGGLSNSMDDNFTYALEKTKSGYSIYETTSTLRSSSASSSQTRNVEEVRPINLYGSYESVNSCCWFIDPPKKLVAGMGFKSLRIYDLRCNAESAVATLVTKAVYGIKSDPFNYHRFASFEDNYIYIWDDRKASDPISFLIKFFRKFNIYTESRPNRIIFSPIRSGLLASVEKDSLCLSLYYIQESTSKQQLSSLQNTPSNRNHDGGDNLSDAKSTFGGSDDELEPLILLKSRKTQRLAKPISSFSWIPTLSTLSSHRFLSINKDNYFDIIKLEESPVFDWEPRGNLAVFGTKGFKIYNVDQRSHEYNYNNDDSKDDIHDNGGGDNQHQHHLKKLASNKDLNSNNNTIYGHKTRVSLDLKFDDDENDLGSRTPRPGEINGGAGQLKGIILHPNNRNNEIFFDHSDNEGVNDIPSILSLLDNDISVIMRGRAKDGYSMTVGLVKDSPKLKSLWSWIARIEKISKEGRVSIGNIDFSFHGIHSVWTASINSGGRRTSPMSTPRASPPKPTTERPDPVNMDYDEIPIVSTIKPLQRKLCLTICGWGFGVKELEDTLRKMEHLHKFEKAAAWALFHGNTERAIKSLNNSGGYTLNFNDKNSHRVSPLWREMCKNLSNELKEPYLRAMFSYIATENWFEVLNEEGLSLQDKIGIALRFLDDDDFSNYLNELTTKAVSNGDIEGILLTGLIPEGVTLFGNYVDKTGDIQTASLALSFCVPRKFKDPRVNIWVENYRLLLDKWQMFHERARFDIARGKHMTSATSSAADIVPPQVYVRCNACGQSIAHALWIPGMRRLTLSNSPHSGIGGSERKSTSCPGCRRPLPRCSICLLSLGTPTDRLRDAIETKQQNNFSSDKPIGFGLWFTWCQSCRHGGHTLHMLQWFQKHRICPV
ncbi:7472_t:CDS:10 [Entrophospora sp. SA101]|nr:7472_t:CDS:10 [Entrophospora sp. SA101]